MKKAGPSGLSLLRTGPLSGVLASPAGHPLAGVPLPSPQRCQSLWPGRMPLLSPGRPFLDSPLPSVSADLCMLGIQLEALDRESAAALESRLGPSEHAPTELAGHAGLLVMPGPVHGFVGISSLGRGWGLSTDGTRSDAGECHIAGRVEDPLLLCGDPAWGRSGRRKDRRQGGLGVDWVTTLGH